MKLGDVVGHGGPSGAKAIGVIRWTPVTEEHVWPQNEHGITPGNERTDYLVETRARDFVIVNYGVSMLPVKWEYVESAEVWYW